MQISLHDVDGHMLRVGVRRGGNGRPPLLLFNGIGANIELVEPFLDVLDGAYAITFDVPGVGGSPARNTAPGMRHSATFTPKSEMRGDSILPAARQA